MSPHEDCGNCDVCARHIVPEDQWPCLTCQRLLCGSCDCPEIHVQEACS